MADKLSTYNRDIRFTFWYLFFYFIERFKLANKKKPVIHDHRHM